MYISCKDEIVLTDKVTYRPHKKHKMMKNKVKCIAQCVADADVVSCKVSSSDFMEF